MKCAGFDGKEHPSTSEHPRCKITDTTVQTFRELLTARLFKPFRLVMLSGQTYGVRHPKMAMLTRTSILVGTGDAEDGIPAEFKICSLLHVTAVEPLSLSVGDSRTD